MASSDPLVSVCLITYNHVAYIRQAIESVLAQNVDFTWEIIIADDYSVDGTREIILDYSTKHPHLIKLKLQERNVGPAQNFVDLLTSASGKYIAYLECDDYWITRSKLSQQVEFLEHNIEYVAAFHDAEYFSQSGDRLNKNRLKRRHDLFAFDLLSGAFVPLMTLLFRRSALTFSKKILEAPNGDVYLCILLGQFGKFKYLPSIFAAYRVNPKGVASSKSMLSQKLDLERTYLALFDEPYLKRNYKSQLPLALTLRRIAKYAAMEGNYVLAIKYLFRFLFASIGHWR